MSTPPRPGLNDMVAVGCLTPSDVLLPFRVGAAGVAIPLPAHLDVDTSGLTATFDLTGRGDILALLTGHDATSGPAAYSLTTDTLWEPLAAPRKRRKLTGKAYRAARRRYARSRRAWVRSGSPMTQVRHYLPNVRAEADPAPGQSIRCLLVPADTIDPDPW